MGSWRLIVLLLLLAAGGATLWYALHGRTDQTGTATAAQTPQAGYDYEAHDVVLRQMGPDGRMTFQIEARQITQLPANGRIDARDLTMYHDPPGTTPGGPNRWTVTADRGELPAEGGVINLAGRVRARGLPVGSRNMITIATDHLRYDMRGQEISTDDEVQASSGSNSMQGRGLRANIKTGQLTLESGHATFVP